MTHHRTRERQYECCLELSEGEGIPSMGLMSGYSWHTDPKRALAVAGGLVYFAADGDLNHSGAPTGLELWRSDGTSKGTLLVSDIWPGPMGSEPSLIVDGGDSDRVVFVARSGSGSQSYGDQGTEQAKNEAETTAKFGERSQGEKNPGDGGISSHPTEGVLDFAPAVHYECDAHHESDEENCDR